MSFTQDVKAEICKNELLDCCSKAQLAALLQINASLTIANQQLFLTFRNQNPTVAKRVVQLLKDNYQVKTQLAVVKQMRFNKSNSYEIRIGEQVREILDDLKLFDEGLVKYPKMSLFKKECCIRAYIAGCFLTTGSVNSPTTSNYHLEISFSDEDIANFVMRLMRKFSLEPKVVVRRNRYVVYLKHSEMISDFLRLTGAFNSLMEFENVRISRDYVNSLLRTNNCDIANAMKAQKAGKAQMEEIKLIIEKVGLDYLDEKLKEVALIRLENEEDSLNELCDKYREIHGVEISKSGMRHRLNKISAVANRLMQKP